MTSNLMFEVGQAKIVELYGAADRRRDGHAIRATQAAARGDRRGMIRRIVRVW